MMLHDLRLAYTQWSEHALMISVCLFRLSLPIILEVWRFVTMIIVTSAHKTWHWRRAISEIHTQQRLFPLFFIFFILTYLWLSPSMKTFL